MATPPSQSDFKSGPVPVAQAPIVSCETKYHALGLEDLQSALVRESAGRTLTPACRYGIEIIGYVDV
jgi:hypothetical protein